MLGCTDDHDDSNNGLIRNIQGTVIGQTSCNSNNGLAYQIAVEILDETDFIVTATLPEDFRQQDLQIEFSMVPSREGITFCTDNFMPEVFYRVFDVRLLPN